jgi:hypothetical protein
MIHATDSSGGEIVTSLAAIEAEDESNAAMAPIGAPAAGADALFAVVRGTAPPIA